MTNNKNYFTNIGAWVLCLFERKAGLGWTVQTFIYLVLPGTLVKDKARPSLSLGRAVQLLRIRRTAELFDKCIFTLINFE